MRREPSADNVPSLRPLRRLAKLPMYIVPVAHTWILWRAIAERATECLGHQHPPRDLRPTEVNVWLRRRIPRDSVRMLEIVIVMASSSTHRQRDREATPTPACAPDALLVIE